MPSKREFYATKLTHSKAGKYNRSMSRAGRGSVMMPINYHSEVAWSTTKSIGTLSFSYSWLNYMVGNFGNHGLINRSIAGRKKASRDYSLQVPKAGI
jgi:hypothetical protein